MRNEKMTNGWRFVLHRCLKWKREHRCDLGSRLYRITLLLHTVTQRHECGPAFVLSTGIKGSRVGSFFVCGRENQTGGSHEELNEKLALFYHINMQHTHTVAACLVGSAVLCPPPTPHPPRRHLPLPLIIVPLSFGVSPSFPSIPPHLNFCSRT